MPGHPQDSNFFLLAELDEKSAMVRAILWLDECKDWQSALVLCDSKSLVETHANSNSNQPDGDVLRIQSASVVDVVTQCRSGLLVY